MRMAHGIDEHIILAKQEARLNFISINYSVEGFIEMVQVFNRTALSSTQNRRRNSG